MLGFAIECFRKSDAEVTGTNNDSHFIAWFEDKNVPDIDQLASYHHAIRHWCVQPFSFKFDNG